MLKDQAELSIEEFALPGGLEWMTAIGASDAAVSILFAGNEPVGTFHLHFTSGRTLRPDDLPLLNALSQQALIELRHALKSVTASTEARCLVLTGSGRVLVVNSGNANAFTGMKGRHTVQVSADHAARALGVIGPLPG